MVEKDVYQTYLDERRLLVEGEVQVSGRFDKSILSLSGGALLLSITFVADILQPSPKAVWLLIIAWVMLGTTIGIMLVSLLTSQKAYRKQRDLLDEQLDNPTANVKCNSWACATQRLNITAITLFLVGILLLGYFTIKNMQTSLGEQNGQQKGNSTAQRAKSSYGTRNPKGSGATEVAQTTTCSKEE